MWLVAHLPDCHVRFPPRQALASVAALTSDMTLSCQPLARRNNTVSIQKLHGYGKPAGIGRVRHTRRLHSEWITYKKFTLSTGRLPDHTKSTTDIRPFKRTKRREDNRAGHVNGRCRKRENQGSSRWPSSSRRRPRRRAGCNEARAADLPDAAPPSPPSLGPPSATGVYSALAYAVWQCWWLQWSKHWLWSDGVGEFAGAGRQRRGRPQRGRTDWFKPPFPVVVPPLIPQHNSALSAGGLVSSYRNKLLANKGT